MLDLAATDAIVSYLCENHYEISDLVIDKAVLLFKLLSGYSVIEKVFGAIAIINPVDITLIPQGPLLLYLIVDKEMRGRGIGTELLNLVIKNYSHYPPLKLMCKGNQRVQFYEKRGFTVINTSGQNFLMQANH